MSAEAWQSVGQEVLFILSKHLLLIGFSSALVASSCLGGTLWGRRVPGRLLTMMDSAMGFKNPEINSIASEVTEAL